MQIVAISNPCSTNELLLYGVSFNQPIHPFEGICRGEKIIIAYDGRLENGGELRQKYLLHLPRTAPGPQIVTGLFENEMAAIVKNEKAPTENNLFEAFEHMLGLLEGPYALVISYRDSLLAARGGPDSPPLFFGKCGETTIIASLPSALEPYGAKGGHPIVTNEVFFCPLRSSPIWARLNLRRSKR